MELGAILIIRRSRRPLLRLCNVVPGKNLANINKDPLEAALAGLRVCVNVQMAQMSGEEIFISYPSKNWWSFMFLFIQTLVWAIEIGCANIFKGYK